MHQYVPVLKMREEELGLFFFPDLATLLETRFAAQKGKVFEKRFAEMGQRFDFVGAETPLKGQGWSYPERNRAGIDYQWALGEQADLGLPIGAPQDALIRFRVLPFKHPRVPPQTLEVWLNETLLERLELPPHWSEQEVVAGAESWRRGANVLYLRFGHSTVPSQLGGGSTDHRALSAAFDFLEVESEGLPES